MAHAIPPASAFFFFFFFYFYKATRDLYLHITLQHTLSFRGSLPPPPQTLTFIPAFVGSVARVTVLKGFASSLSSSSHFHFVTVFSSLSFFKWGVRSLPFFQLFQVRHSSMLMKAATASSF